MLTKSKKTVVALLCCLSLVLSACGSGDKPTDTTKTAPTAAAPTSAASTSTETSSEEKLYWELLNEVSDTSELPSWTGEKLDITIWYSHGNGVATGLPAIPENDVYLQEIERVTGVHLNVEEFFDNNGVDLNAKLPLMLATGDLPDLVFTGNITQLKDLANAGKLWDLTPHMSALDQLTSKVPMDEYSSWYQNKAGLDGGIYLLSNNLNMEYYQLAPDKFPELKDDILTYVDKCLEPNTPSGRNGTNSFVVREDILLGLYPQAHSLKQLQEIYTKNGTYTAEEIYDIPMNNADDFFKMLENIQTYIEANDTVGINGRKVNVTYGPYVGLDNWGWMEDLPQLLYGYTHNNYFSSFNLKTGRLEIPFREESGKAQLKTLNTLLRKGIISKDSLVDDQNTFNEKLNNAQYAVLYAQNAEALNQTLVSEGNADYIYRPVHINMDWDIAAYPTWLGTPECKGLAIFKDSVSEEELPQLLHWANYLFSDLHSKLMYWGPESAGLYKEVDGKLAYTDPELEANMLSNVQNGAGAKYGLKSDDANKYFVMADQEWIPKAVGRGLYMPKFMYDKQISEAESMKYYSPFVIGRTGISSQKEITTAPAIWNFTASISSLNDFWNARKGFEDQMKKVVASESDGQFDKQYQELLTYAEANGYTDEAVEEWNKQFFEKNDYYLRQYGIIK